MVERINGKTILTTPVSAEDLEGIKIGDIIYLNGSMTTCRDVAHRRVVEEGREIPSFKNILFIEIITCFTKIVIIVIG